MRRDEARRKRKKSGKAEGFVLGVSLAAILFCLFSMACNGGLSINDHNSNTTTTTTNDNDHKRQKNTKQ